MYSLRSDNRLTDVHCTPMILHKHSMGSFLMNQIYLKRQSLYGSTGSGVCG